MAVTDAAARLLAQEYRDAFVALDVARDACREKERALAQALRGEPGRTLVVKGWRLSTEDGEGVIATRERVVT